MSYWIILYRNKCWISYWKRLSKRDTFASSPFQFCWISFIDLLVNCEKHGERQILSSSLKEETNTYLTFDKNKYCPTIYKNGYIYQLQYLIRIALQNDQAILQQLIMKSLGNVYINHALLSFLNIFTVRNF